MQQITFDQTILAGALFAGLVAANQAARCAGLLGRRRRVREYDRFVRATYTAQGRDIPPMIRRIRDERILQYNLYLSECRLWSLFFKQMRYLDQRPPAQPVDLYPLAYWPE